MGSTARVWINPRMMNKAQAAAYVGVSADVFKDEWEPKLHPSRKREGNENSHMLFDRHEIDAILDQKLAIANAGLDPNDPILAALSP